MARRSLPRFALPLAVPPLALSLALVACGDKVPTGELGRGEFQYTCPSGPDSACVAGSALTSIQLPAQVAVGASFAVSYAPTVDNGTAIVQGATGYTVLPAAQELASGSGDTLVAQRSGYVALLARHNGTQNVDDYVHLRLTPIARVTPDQSVVTLSGGDSRTVTLTPYDAEGADLAGQIACTWSVTGAAQVAAFTPQGLGGAVTLEGIADGATTLHAVCGAATADLSVTVGGLVTDGGTHD